MIPDKIYVGIRPSKIKNVVYITITGESPNAKEYVRKDALLDWAKSQQAQMKIEAGGCSNMHATGKWIMLQELIEKLNSL